MSSSRSQLADLGQALASQATANRGAPGARRWWSTGDARLQSDVAKIGAQVGGSVTWQLFERARRRVNPLLGGRDSRGSALAGTPPKKR